MGILNNKPPRPTSAKVTTKKVGDGAEDAALEYLLDKGMQLVARNYRTPGRGGGEIDLIVRAPDGTLVFVEVRKRSKASHGGAAASVSFAKQRRIIFAARHFLMGLQKLPPCRFDVMALEPDGTEWLQAAFDAA
ncbi:MAG: YraN family protein [Burkholderiales bacterium PBB4]|nr:MAG: YraN family protein [Burkholderiales bacterium PBB4]